MIRIKEDKAVDLSVATILLVSSLYLIQISEDKFSVIMAGLIGITVIIYATTCLEIEVVKNE